MLEAAEARLNELKNAQGYQTQLQSVLAYIRSTVTPKANQSTNGDWAVMALAARGSAPTPTSAGTRAMLTN